MEHKQEPCEDAISRAEAIKAICGDKCDLTPDKCLNGIIGDCVQIRPIKDLPSVEPKPKTGHWIEDAETYYKAINEKGGGVNENTPYFTDDIACSECLAKFSVIDNETQRFKCCPNCGAKMSESEVSE